MACRDNEEEWDEDYEDPDFWDEEPQDTFPFPDEPQFSDYGEPADRF